MENYLNFLLTPDPTNFENRKKINEIIEKGEQIFRNTDELNVWLNKSVLSFDKALFDDTNKNIYLDFLSEEIDRLVQGYCV